MHKRSLACCINELKKKKKLSYSNDTNQCINNEYEHRYLYYNRIMSSVIETLCAKRLIRIFKYRWLIYRSVDFSQKSRQLYLALPASKCDNIVMGKSLLKNNTALKPRIKTSPLLALCQPSNNCRRWMLHFYNCISILSCTEVYFILFATHTLRIADAVLLLSQLYSLWHCSIFFNGESSDKFTQIELFEPYHKHNVCIVQKKLCCLVVSRMKFSACSECKLCVFRPGADW